jgi:hypothetical protein
MRASERAVSKNRYLSGVIVHQSKYEQASYTQMLVVPVREQLHNHNISPEQVNSSGGISRLRLFDAELCQ